MHRSPVLEGAGDGGGGVTRCPAHGFVDQYELGADPALGSFWIADNPDATKVTRAPRRYHKYKMGPLTESVLTEHFAVAAGSVYAFTWQICPGGTRARANL